jgi:predicted phosphoribosyltransferase
MAAGTRVCHDRGVKAEALFADRRDAGRVLARALADEQGPDTVVVGLARGGVVVAAEVAHALGLPLDVVAVRKVGHPWQPEYALGAVAPGGGVYVRDPGGLTEAELAEQVERAEARAAELDRALHTGRREPIPLAGRTCLLVDDGLATGATMIAAVRWARSRGAARVVAAVPVGAAQSAAMLREEADAVVCPHELFDLGAVGFWYRDFGQVDDAEVAALL